MASIIRRVKAFIATPVTVYTWFFHPKLPDQLHLAHVLGPTRLPPPNRDESFLEDRLVFLCPRPTADVIEVRAWFTDLFWFLGLNDPALLASGIEWTGWDLHLALVSETCDLLCDLVGLPQEAAELVAEGAVAYLIGVSSPHLNSLLQPSWWYWNVTKISM